MEKSEFVKKAIENAVNKNLDEMRTNVGSALAEKAQIKLNEKKREIAENYFGQK